MIKTRILFIVSIIFLLTNCASKMKPEHFSRKKESEQITTFKVQLTYDGDSKDLDSNSCHMAFSDKDKKVLKYRVKDDYIFITTHPQDIYLNYLTCNSYHVLYNKVRFRKINQKILSAAETSKIAYGGDITIEWTPEIFKVSDLFNFGHMGLEDNGDFEMALEDNYNSYLNFMKQAYNKEPGESLNKVEQQLVDNIKKQSEFLEEESS